MKFGIRTAYGNPTVWHAQSLQLEHELRYIPPSTKGHFEIVKGD